MVKATARLHQHHAIQSYTRNLTHTIAQNKKADIS